MTDKKRVTLQTENSQQYEVLLHIENSPPWTVGISDARLGVLEFAGFSLYDSFQKLREHLEAKGYKLLCNGARVDLVVSGMSRQMSSGRMGYIARIGEATTKESIVDIFDYAEPEKVGSIGEQKAFYKKWVEALKNG